MLGPHRLDDVVPGFAAGFIFDFDIQRAIEIGPVADGFAEGFMPVDMAAQFADEFGHRIDVAEARDAMQGHLLAGHQRSGNDGQRAILAAADFNFAFES